MFSLRIIYFPSNFLAIDYWNITGIDSWDTCLLKGIPNIHVHLEGESKISKIRYNLVTDSESKAHSTKRFFFLVCYFLYIFPPRGRGPAGGAWCWGLGVGVACPIIYSSLLHLHLHDVWQGARSVMKHFGNLLNG